MGLSTNPILVNPFYSNRCQTLNLSRILDSPSFFNQILPDLTITGRIPLFLAVSDLRSGTEVGHEHEEEQGGPKAQEPSSLHGVCLSERFMFALGSERARADGAPGSWKYEGGSSRIQTTRETW